MKAAHSLFAAILCALAAGELHDIGRHDGLVFALAAVAGLLAGVVFPILAVEK